MIEFKKGDIVFKEGTVSEAFYIIVSGRFEAYSIIKERKKVFAYLRRGDYFGEMSLLNDENHTATIEARSDSLVLELKKEQFKTICEHSASISLQISRVLVERLKHQASLSDRPVTSDVVSVFSLQPRMGSASFVVNLTASLWQLTKLRSVLVDLSPSARPVLSQLRLSEEMPVVLLKDLANIQLDQIESFLYLHPDGFHVLNITYEEKEASGHASVIAPLLNQLAVDFRFVMINLPPNVDDFVLKVFSQSDKIFFVTDNQVDNLGEIKKLLQELSGSVSVPDERVNVVIQESLLGIRINQETRVDFFGQAHCFFLPRTPDLMEDTEKSMSPFVIRQPDDDYSRMIQYIGRSLSHNLVGLALSSGAALGFAHIGVLKVLEKEKIPIDVVAGSSMGALVAALWAIGLSASEIEKIALKMNRPRTLFLYADLCFIPLRGLFKGRRIAHYLKRYFGNRTFEDTRIPLKIVATDVYSRQTIVIEKGSLLEAVRASIAIPGVFKPVVRENEVLLDGGILNPLPIRSLIKAGAHKLIGVNVLPGPGDIQKRRFYLEQLEEQKLKKISEHHWLVRIANRLRSKIVKFFMPNLIDIMMNTLQTTEFELSEIEGQEADLIIRPVIPIANWVEFYKADRFIRKGEEEAMNRIEEIRKLLTEQTV